MKWCYEDLRSRSELRWSCIRLIHTNLGRSTCYDLGNGNWIDPSRRPTPFASRTLQREAKVKLGSFKQAEILKVKNQVMYIGRIGWAVRLVSKIRTVRCGETHQMMYEIVDLSILQHFWVIDNSRRWDSCIPTESRRVKIPKGVCSSLVSKESEDLEIAGPFG